MPVNRRWSVDGLVEAPLVDQGNDLVLITKLVGIDRAVMTTQIDEHDGHVGGDRMVDAEQVSEIKPARSEEHTSELQSLMRISYAVFCLKKKNQQTKQRE